DLDLRDTCVRKALLQRVTELQVLVEQLRVFLVGEPARTPRLVEPEAEAVRMNFLTHAGAYSVAAAARLFFEVVFLAPAFAAFGRFGAARFFAGPSEAATFVGRSVTSTVRCAVRLMIRNARPIGAGRIRFCDGPWLA